MSTTERYERVVKLPKEQLWKLEEALQADERAVDVERQKRETRMNLILYTPWGKKLILEGE